MPFSFDPVKVGSYECDWWIAHNDHDRAKMIKYLLAQHKECYGFSLPVSTKAVSYLAKAAKAHDVRDWDEAIKFAADYYALIEKKTELSFDPKELAQLEINWWKIHDELEFNLDKTKLIKAFADLYTAQFNIDKESAMKAGEAKAKATRAHDLAEDPNTKPEDVEGYWQQCRDFLIATYEELAKVI